MKTPIMMLTLLALLGCAIKDDLPALSAQAETMQQAVQELQHVQHAKIVLTVVVKTAEDRTTNVNVVPNSDPDGSAIWYAVLA
mgnify:CR=1 FL=1